MISQADRTILQVLAEAKEPCYLYTLKDASNLDYLRLQEALKPLLNDGSIRAEWDEDNIRIYQITQRGRLVLEGKDPDAPANPFLNWLNPSQ